MASPKNPWKCPAGDAQTYTVFVTNGSGATIVNTYAGTEPLTATVWQGSDLAPIAGVVSASWLSGPAGSTTVKLTPPADLAPGYYRVRLEVTYQGQKSPYYFGWIKVEAVAGSGAASPVYGSYQDMVDLAGDWLTRLQQGDPGDETTFLRERAMAREWLDDIIVSRSRVFAYRFDLTYALYYGSFPFGPVEAPDSVIAGYLASDFLQVVPRTIECTTYKALAFACEKRMTFDADGEAFRQRAIFYHRKASNSLRRYRCTLDTDGDGNADIAFNLGVLTFR